MAVWIDRDRPSAIQGRFGDAYHAWVKRCSYWILAFWTIVLGVGVYLGPQFLANTNMTFGTPPDAPSSIAQAQLEVDFPEKKWQQSAIVVVKNLPDATTPVTSQALHKFDVYLKEKLEDARFFRSFENPMGVVINYSSYWDYKDNNMTFVADQTVRGNTTIIMMDIDVSDTEETNKFTEFLDTQVHELAPMHKSAKYELTGVQFFIRDVSEGVERDLAKMDMIVAPIAMLVLCSILQSVRLMIIPILTIATSALTAFSLMLPVSYTMNVITFAPSIMMSAMIAMSIDYSLFLLTRLHEEFNRGHGMDEAVRVMIHSSGHTIMVSGAALSLCFLGLVFFPLDLMRSIGIGASIAIIVTVIVNLSLTPALLVTFPKFFPHFFDLGELWSKWMQRARQRNSSRQDDIRSLRQGDESVTSASESPVVTIGRSSTMEHMTMCQSRWWKLGEFAQDNALLVVLIIVGCTVPFALFAFTFTQSSSSEMVTPRGSPSAEAYNELIAAFSPGLLAPYFLVVEPRDGVLLDESFFDRTRESLSTIDSSSKLGIMVYNSSPIPVGWVEKALSKEPADRSDMDNIIVQLFNNNVSKKTNATIVQVEYDRDPSSPEGREWLHETRKHLENQMLVTGDSYYLAGGAGMQLDSIDRIYELFPTMISVTTATVFALVAVMFRSVLAPLRSVVSIAVTLIIVFGFASITYEHGGLNFLNAAPLAGVGALCWITPVMSFSILVGLGLDYDVFLLSRVLEFRLEGKSDREAISMGLYKTGGIITAAGVIMAIAFSGLFMSAQMVLNQFSFFLVFAVMIDTFVVRTLLVPALMALAGRWNWWPRKTPLTDRVDDCL